jgi:hypothetical protein
MSRRALTAVLLAVPVLACAACSGSSAAAGGQAGTAASCADLVTIAGTRYVGGRDGEGAKPVPHTGSALDAVRPSCADGNEPSSQVVVHTIPGVRVEDAVAGPLGYEVLIAERWWQQPRDALPAALQPYVRR